MQAAPLQELPDPFFAVRYVYGRKGYVLGAILRRAPTRRRTIFFPWGAGLPTRYWRWTGRHRDRGLPLPRQCLRGAFHHRAGWNGTRAGGRVVEGGRQGGRPGMRSQGPGADSPCEEPARTGAPRRGGSRTRPASVRPARKLGLPQGARGDDGGHGETRTAGQRARRQSLQSNRGRRTTSGRRRAAKCARQGAALRAKADACGHKGRRAPADPSHGGLQATPTRHACFARTGIAACAATRQCRCGLLIACRGSCSWECGRLARPDHQAPCRRGLTTECNRQIACGVLQPPGLPLAHGGRARSTSEIRCAAWDCISTSM